MFARTLRNTEPEALTDPKYGTHGYLHLEVRILLLDLLLEFIQPIHFNSIEHKTSLLDVRQDRLIGRG